MNSLQETWIIFGNVNGEFGSRLEIESRPNKLATVWIVKGRLMEKRKTVVLFPAFPQRRLRLVD
jgi:hypothetical protein